MNRLQGRTSVSALSKTIITVRRYTLGKFACENSIRSYKTLVPAVFSDVQ